MLDAVLSSLLHFLWGLGPEPYLCEVHPLPWAVPPARPTEIFKYSLDSCQLCFYGISKDGSQGRSELPAVCRGWPRSRFSAQFFLSGNRRSCCPEPIVEHGWSRTVATNTLATIQHCVQCTSVCASLVVSHVLMRGPQREAPGQNRQVLMELVQAGMSPVPGSVSSVPSSVLTEDQNPMTELGSGQPVAYHYPGCPLHVALLKVFTNHS